MNDIQKLRSLGDYAVRLAAARGGELTFEVTSVLQAQGSANGSVTTTWLLTTNAGGEFDRDEARAVIEKHLAAYPHWLPEMAAYFPGGYDDGTAQDAIEVIGEQEFDYAVQTLTDEVLAGLFDGGWEDRVAPLLADA